MNIKRKFQNVMVIYSVNPLYLRIIIMNGQLQKGKDNAWYLVISDKDDAYKKFADILESIKNKITEKNMGCCRI